jgi:hypothetical protein
MASAKKKPTDSTLRNVRASQRRDAVLRRDVAWLKRRVKAIERRLYLVPVE